MPDPRAVPVGLIACLCTAFVAIGSSIASLGPALPEFARAAGVDVSAIGMLFSALFAGMLTSQVTAGLLLDRTGTRTMILAALGVFTAGTFGVASSSRLVTLLPAAAILGAGYGLTTVTINLVASRLLPHRPAFVLNLINVLYGSGAVLGPLLASVALRAGGQARWVPAIGGVALLGVVPWAWKVLPADGPSAHRATTPQRWTFPLPLLLIGGLVFLYGGVEAGFGGWAATYVEQTLRVTPARAALLTSAYWFAYVSGRVLSTALALRVGPGRVLQCTVGALAAGGLVLFASVGHATGTTIAIIIIGAATGPIWPSMFGVVTARFADRAALAVSSVAALGAIGAMLLPWTMGLTLPLAGGRVLAASPLVLAIGMWVCYQASTRRPVAPPTDD